VLKAIGIFLLGCGVGAVATTAVSITHIREIKRLLKEASSDPSLSERNPESAEARRKSA
jgi:hypothetical protein